jgi:hypothetical protein
MMKSRDHQERKKIPSLVTWFAEIAREERY